MNWAKSKWMMLALTVANIICIPMELAFPLTPELTHRAALVWFSATALFFGAVTVRDFLRRPE